MPSPRPARGQLIVMNGPDRGHHYAISVGRSELGRSPEAAIPITDVNVSRQHAALESTEQRVVLIDLGSVNGTWVNNRRLHGPCPLRDGDIVAVGTVLLRFRGTAADSLRAGAGESGPEGVAFGEMRSGRGAARPRRRRGAPCYIGMAS
jgi:pSer/pThr/pTyr-binding forkhead associated (FHA) protein